MRLWVIFAVWLLAANTTVHAASDDQNKRAKCYRGIVAELYSYARIAANDSSQFNEYVNQSLQKNFGSPVYIDSQTVIYDYPARVKLTHTTGRIADVIRESNGYYNHYALMYLRDKYRQNMPLECLGKLDL